MQLKLCVNLGRVTSEKESVTYLIKHTLENRHNVCGEKLDVHTSDTLHDAVKQIEERHFQCCMSGRVGDPCHEDVSDFKSESLMCVSEVREIEDERLLRPVRQQEQLLLELYRHHGVHCHTGTMETWSEGDGGLMAWLIVLVAVNKCARRLGCV